MLKLAAVEGLEPFTPGQSRLPLPFGFTAIIGAVVAWTAHIQEANPPCLQHLDETAKLGPGDRS